MTVILSDSFQCLVDMIVSAVVADTPDKVEKICRYLDQYSQALNLRLSESLVIGDEQCGIESLLEQVVRVVTNSLAALYPDESMRVQKARCLRCMRNVNERIVQMKYRRENSTATRF